MDASMLAILEVADEGFLVFGSDGRCALATLRLLELFGTTTLVGAPEQDALAQLASACEEPETFLSNVARARTESSVFEVELRRPTLRIVLFQTRPTEGGFVGVARDVTRERSAERRAHQLLQRLEQMTSTDALTQLPNRKRFLEELEREHGRATRAWDSYAVVRVDIDGLATINDELGIPRGDEVLETVADRLRQGRREYDLLARWGEDEFVLLAPGADAHGAEAVARRMSQAVSSEPFEIGERRRVTVTIGAAVWVPPSNDKGTDVLSLAGDALEKAQARGAGTIEIV